jgi:DNA-binding transcriptional MocR family regulator
VAPGQDFDPLGADRGNLRLSVSRIDKRNIDRGIRVLAEAVEAVERASAAATSVPMV